MSEITLELVRKRAEHNEGLVTTLEELSLHQEELVGINTFLNRNCRQLKILYLQNNIISRMENLSHLRQLEYLNLALNNIEKVDGLQNCEFLQKLDLTVNFIDLDELRGSVEHLQALGHLEDLYLMGNPCQTKWSEEPSKYRQYIVAKLPQLRRLDGTDIERSERILATQRLEDLEAELEAKAAEVREEKARKATTAEAVETLRELPDGELTEHTPEVRTAMYREMAEQKSEKQAQDDAMKPRERDHAKEHEESVRNARHKEEEQIKERDNRLPRQTNQAGLDFSITEEGREGRGAVLLDLELPRHLDSSLIDVDVHPKYVSVVVKNKRLLLHLPAEVASGRAKAERSRTSGNLLITMPKVNPDENMLSLRAAQRREKEEVENRKKREVRQKRRKDRNRSLASQMMAAGEESEDDDSSPEEDETEELENVPAAPQELAGPVQIQGLVPRRFGGIGKGATPTIRAVSTQVKSS